MNRREKIFKARQSYDAVTFPMTVPAFQQTAQEERKRNDKPAPMISTPRAESTMPNDGRYEANERTISPILSHWDHSGEQAVQPVVQNSSHDREEDTSEDSSAHTSAILDLYGHGSVEDANHDNGGVLPVHSSPVETHSRTPDKFKTDKSNLRLQAAKNSHPKDTKRMVHTLNAAKGQVDDLRRTAEKVCILLPSTNDARYK